MKNWKLKKLKFNEEEFIPGTINKLQEFGKEEESLIECFGLLQGIGLDLICPELGKYDDPVSIVLEIENEKNQETLTLSVVWSHKKVLSEKILENGELVVKRSEIESDDNIPVFGGKWDGSREDMFWTWFEYVEKDEGLFRKLYLSSLTWQGKMLWNFYSSKIIIANPEEIELEVRKKYGCLSILNLWWYYSTYIPYSTLFAGIREVEIMRWYNEIFPLLGFSGISITGDGIVKENGISFELEQMGSGFKHLIIILPLLKAHQKNHGVLLVRYLNLSLFPTVYRELLRLIREWEKDDKGTLFYSDTI